jgi:hypothetical protein
MNTQENFTGILKTDAASLAAKAAELSIQYPYFDIAHIANAVTHKEDKNKLQVAALYTQNDMWLHYILTPNEFVTSSIESNTLVQTNIETISLSHATTQAVPMETSIIEEMPVIKELPIPTTETTADKAEIAATDNIDTATITTVVEASLETNEPEAIVAEPEKTISNAINEPIIELEPYHTIDYFASQGIKLSHMPQSDDRLGQQVKSFTSWLKSMRKIDTIVDKPVVEEKTTEHVHVVSLAENSLQKEEIITETMAEVLVKQGKIAEAIALYEKLSLQDTEKSSYFASQIENLKTV